MVFIVAPRATASVIEGALPTISWEVFQERIGQVFGNGYEDRPGYAEQLAELENNTLKQYGVERLSDLPVGFSGIRMLHMSAWASEVSDREYLKMKTLWGQQSHMRTTASFAFPYLAVRTISQNMAGTDWFHYRDFSEKSEAYRRDIVHQLDLVLKAEMRGDKWEMDVDKSVWSTTSPFSYQPPSFKEAIKQAWTSLAILLLWCVCACVILLTLARRLTP